MRKRDRRKKRKDGWRMKRDKGRVRRRGWRWEKGEEVGYEEEDRRRRGNGWRMRGCCEEQTWRSHSSRGVMEGGDEGGDGERGGRVTG